MWTDWGGGGGSDSLKSKLFYYMWICMYSYFVFYLSETVVENILDGRTHWKAGLFAGGKDRK